MKYFPLCIFFWDTEVQEDWLKRQPIRSIGSGKANLDALRSSFLNFFSQDVA